MLSYVALAVGNGSATTQATVLGATWAKFSTGTGPADVQTWDGRTMSYYTQGFKGCATSAFNVVQNVDQSGLPTTSAQCGAFALLLESALATNGIHSNWIQIFTNFTDPDLPELGPPKMVIKNWCFIGATGCPSGSPSYPSASPWIYKLTLNPVDYMVPVPTSGFGDLTNLAGVRAQGEDGASSPPLTPLEKVFDLHFIVQIPTIDGLPLSGNQYFDPSYGVTYPSQAGFEAQAVAGYAFAFSTTDSAAGIFHLFTPIAGSPAIAFLSIPGSSM